MVQGKIKKRILFIIFWVLLIASFIFSAFLILLKANGYQLNYKNWKIVQTGMIILSGDPNLAQATLNGRKLGHLPLRLSNITPGNYEAIVEQENYSLWKRTFRVEPGKATTFQNIILFLTQAQDYSFKESSTIDGFKEEAAKYTQGVEISAAEIYYENQLVTRFSQNVLSASLYPDRKHLIFQVANEIRVIELDGGNNTLLFNINSQEPSTFSYRENGRVVLYLEQEQILGKTIR